MKPIELRSDTAYLQALRCVEFRVPPLAKLQKQGYVLTLGLRYGLIGIAATFQLLETANSEDEKVVMDLARSWPRLVEDHVRFETHRQVPFPCDAIFPVAVSRCAERPLRLALPLLRRLCPLDSCLAEATEQFIAENRYGIRLNWPLFRRRQALKEFRRHAELSTGYALHFFERRQYDLEEVPEIALLGE
jgi:hypothetical protein